MSDSLSNTDKDRVNELVDKLRSLAERKPALKSINYDLVEKVVSDMLSEQNQEQLYKRVGEALYQHNIEEIDYAKLASRLAVWRHHETTDSSFIKSMKRINAWVPRDLRNHPQTKIDKRNKVVSDRFIGYIDYHTRFGRNFDDLVNHDRDYEFYDSFAISTLERSYLIKLEKKVVERVQHMWMRCAVELGRNDWDEIKRTYEYLSNHFYTHATPTLYTSGNDRYQPSSCKHLSLHA